MVIGSSQKADGTADSSGLAELVGNDLLVTFGGWGFNRDTQSNTNSLLNSMASTIMHELGHNLGIRHGGFEDTNNKPNYYSIMNYDYQLSCLGLPTGTSVGERYYLRAKLKGITDANLTNGPTGPDCLIDFSNGTSAALNELALNENDGIGRGAGTIDWNDNNVTEANISRDINDWGNLVLPFARSFSAFNNGVSKHSVKQRLMPVANDRQQFAAEESPSPEFFRQLRESMAKR
jgi:hypothetical protein